MAMWQLKATLPSSLSSRKRATTSLDLSCPMTSMARHSLLGSYTLTAKGCLACPARADSFRAFGTALPPHVKKIRRLTTTCSSSHINCQKVQTNQPARLERFSRDEGVGRLVVRSHHRLLPEKEEEELAMGPTLPWNIPTGGRCAQTHTVPWGPTKARRLPRRVFSHIFCKIPVPAPLQAIAIHAAFHEALRTNGPDSLVGSPSTSKLCPNATIGSLRCSSHSSRRVFLLPKMLSLRLSHNILSPFPLLPSWPKGLSLFHSLWAFWLLLPCSSLCSDSTPLQLLGRRHASPHQQAAASICRSHCGQH